MRGVLVVAICAALGCVDHGAGPQAKRVEPGYVPAHLLKTRPAVISASLDVELGGKVVYLGNNVTTLRLVPGQPFKITHYWQVVAPPGPRWAVFTILRGAAHTADFMNLPPTEMMRAHGPATWNTGEIIEDEQEIYLRPDWKSHEATLSVGLLALGAHDIGDRMEASGPHVRDRAVIARVFEVDVAKGPPPPGTLHVPYAAGAIVIDGVANDVGWSNAAKSGEFVTAEGSPEPPGGANARLSWDDQHLYVFVGVTDPDIFSEYKQQDDPLWKQDCVELFIDADGNRRGYVELQVNPNNATFDSWFAQGRAAKGDEAWDSGMITAVKVRTTPDVAGDADQGWEVEIAIPWAAVKGAQADMAVRLPPQVGDRWRINVVRVDKRSGSQTPAASSWNRITYADWHGLDRMLTVVFADVKGGVTPGAVPVPVDDGVGGGSGSAAGSGQGSATAPGQGSATPGQGSASVPAQGSASVPAQGSATGASVPAQGSAAALGRATAEIQRLAPQRTLTPAKAGSGAEVDGARQGPQGTAKESPGMGTGTAKESPGTGTGTGAGTGTGTGTGTVKESPGTGTGTGTGAGTGS